MVNVQAKRVGIAALAVVLLSGSSLMAPAEAQSYRASVARSQYKARTFFQSHPKVKSATVGAAVGTAAGAGAGLLSGRGILRGALIGAGTGAGVGLIRSSHVMNRHPIVNDTATGAVVGLGLGAAASRGHHKLAAATGIGAAAGLGLGLLRDTLR